MNNFNIEDYALKHPKTKSAKISPYMLIMLESLKKGSKILDVGCASGHTLAEINKRYPGKYRLYGVDLSKTRIEEAKKNFPEINFEVASAQELPFQNNNFDVLLSSQVIEHVPDDKKMVREISRVLNKDGIFQVDSVIKKRFGWYFYRSPIGWALDPTHVREYSSSEDFKSLFIENNLNILKLTFERVVRPLNILPFLKFLDGKYKILIPRYFTIFLIGKK